MKSPLDSGQAKYSVRMTDSVEYLNPFAEMFIVEKTTHKDKADNRGQITSKVNITASSPYSKQIQIVIQQTRSRTGKEHTRGNQCGNEKTLGRDRG